MNDYRHELRFGVFLTPRSDHPDEVVALAGMAEEAGIDLVTFQDHPYQPAFVDTWTLISYVAAATTRVRLAANVHSLPLRQPAVLARSVASLDRLTAGRIELGLGAGGFWDAVAAMGGPRRTPGEAVEALEEALDVIRGIWNVDDQSRLEVDGAHYSLSGAKRGPAPAHPVEIWIGGNKPRMLDLIGRRADGWLPTLGYQRDVAASNATIDAAARRRGRRPEDIRRLVNVSGTFDPDGRGDLVGSPDVWIDRLTDLATTHGFSTFILSGDDPGQIERFMAEVAPVVRQRVEATRAG